MSKMGVHFTSKSQTWNTPHTLFDPINEVWKFTCDVASLDESALVDKHYTPENSGLDKDWSSDIVWCNPPYDDLKTWVHKCHDEYKNGATVVMLIPARTDTIAFHDYILNTCTGVCFIKGRLKFSNPNVDTNMSAPFPSCLVIYDDNLTPEKLEVLSKFGKFLQIKE